MVAGRRPLHPSVRSGHGAQAKVAREGKVLEVLDPADRAAIEVPELPMDRLWDPRTSAWWVDAWQSPMRLEWDPADAHALLQVAYLVDEFWKVAGADEVDHAAMVKLSKATADRLVRLGLDPFARRSLTWLLVRTERDEAERDESKARTAAARSRSAGKAKRPRGDLSALE